MYAQLRMSDHLPQIENAENYQRALMTGNWAMLISLTVIIVSTAMAYGLEHHLTIAPLVTAHIAMIIAAGTLKIGYVMRCVALKAFGSQAF